MKTASKLRLMGAAGALAALTAVSVGGAASASTAEKGAPAVKTIKIKGDEFKDLKFVGPDTIVEGQTLEVVNQTKAKLQPHTFSLVTKDALPKQDEWKACGKFKPSTVCDDVVFGAHQVEFPPEGEPIVNEPDVDNGLEGWDLSFDNVETQGDTWFTPEKGHETSRTVSAQVNKLFYFCVVHPNMSGKIGVEHPA